jgi:hypothetical protein
VRAVYGPGVSLYTCGTVVPYALRAARIYVRRITCGDAVRTIILGCGISDLIKVTGAARATTCGSLAGRLETRAV